MPMERDNHESLLNELLTEDLTTSRKTEILQELRTDYDSVIHDHQDLTTNNQKLQSEKDDLVVSNSKLFRDMKIHDPNEGKEKEEEQKEFSETVTIEQLEKQAQ